MHKDLVKIAVMILVAASCVLWGSPPASACSCGSLGIGRNAESLLEHTDAAFLGEVVVGIRPDEDFLPSEYVVRVLEAWKGSLCEEQALQSFLADCAPELLEGETYLIFASELVPARDYLSLDCARVFVMSEADDLLDQLGTGELPMSGLCRARLCGITGLTPLMFLCGGMMLMRFLSFPRRQRHRRAALGLCANCEHDQHGSGERCPECGTAFEMDRPVLHGGE